jgi:hypothetical protein
MIDKKFPRCSWEACKSPGTHAHKDSDGRIWARFCETHHQTMTRLIDSSEKIKRQWSDGFLIP